MLAFTSWLIYAMSINSLFALFVTKVLSKFLVHFPVLLQCSAYFSALFEVCPVVSEVLLSLFFPCFRIQMDFSPFDLVKFQDLLQSESTSSLVCLAGSFLHFSSQIEVLI